MLSQTRCRFENLSTLEINNAKHECLLIKYANDDKLYLPVENIEVLSRYGSDISDEMLDKLGGISWTTRKENLKKKIKFFIFLGNFYGKRTTLKERNEMRKAG